MKKKRKKKGKVKKKREEEEEEEEWGRITVDYCCNPQWNVCGGTVTPPHHLEYVLISTYDIRLRFNFHQTYLWCS